MNEYETIILISNKITKKQKENIVTKIKKLISENGTIIEIEDMGEKALAYEVKKHKKAFYYIINFKSKSEFIHELERNYRINDDILRFMTIRKSED